MKDTMDKRMEPKIRTSLVYQQARRHHQNGEIGEAVTLYGQVLAAQPRHTPALLHLGEIARQTGNLDQASVLLTRAIAVDPQFTEAYDIFWQVRKELGDLEGATTILLRLLEIRRHDGYIYFNLGLLYHERGQILESRRMFNLAIRYKSDDPHIYAAIGEVQSDQGRVDEAAASYRQAILYDPKNSLYHMRLGELLSRQGQWQAALGHIDRASLLDPNNDAVRRNRWQTLLRLGHLEEGFAEAETRFQMKEYRSVFGMYTEIPRWHGEPFSGRLLIHPENSMEDILQFARYLPQVKAQGGTLVLALPRPLMKLFSNLQHVDEIIEATPASIRATQADLTASITSLPALFGTTMQTVPGNTPYLFVDPFLTHSWVRQIHWKTYRIGLAWSVGDESETTPAAQRSARLEDMEALMEIPGISWYSLQLEPGASVDLTHNRLPIIDCSAGLRDYSDVAALAANLDLVIAVDSPQAHLAAAIGRPVWTMLPFEAGWRWLHRREDSPWYPTMRLFQQPQPGDWNGVIQQVAAALSPKFRPFRKFQPLQGAPAALFADTAVQY